MECAYIAGVYAEFGVYKMIRCVCFVLIWNVHTYVVNVCVCGMHIYICGSVCVCVYISVC